MVLPWEGRGASCSADMKNPPPRVTGLPYCSRSSPSPAVPCLNPLTAASKAQADRTSGCSKNIPGEPSAQRAAGQSPMSRSSNRNGGIRYEKTPRRGASEGFCLAVCVWSAIEMHDRSPMVAADFAGRNPPAVCIMRILRSAYKNAAPDSEAAFVKVLGDLHACGDLAVYSVREARKKARLRSREPKDAYSVCWTD